ncbi:MAG TPA: hypothetical protein VJA44_07705 [Acidimicrobiia bacterium]|nr:hypothetical protein [Acidimicrobiia bacterium]
MKRAALLLIHGMGEQLPWEEPDSFIRGLVRRYMSRPDPPPGEATTPDLDAVHLELLMDVSDGMPPRSRPGVRIRIRNTPRQPRRSRLDAIDVHQVYWADRPQGVISWTAVAKWLLVSSFTPLFHWRRNAAVIVQEKRWGRKGPGVGRLLLELFLGASVPLLGLFLVTTVTLALRGLAQLAVDARDVVGGFGAAERWTLGAVLLMGAVALAALIGSVRVLQRARREAELALFADHRDTGRESVVGPGSEVRPPWQQRTERLLKWGRVSALGGVAVAVLTAVLTRVWDVDPWSVVEEVSAQLGWAWWEALIIAAGAALAPFLVKWLGDVAVYAAGANPLNRFAPVRRDILDRVASSLAELEHEYDEIFIAAHSLGSVIAYDALNERHALDWAGGKGTRTGRVKGFLAFGSPLDKFYYFFRRQSFAKPVMEQIESSSSFLWKRSSGRRYGEVEFEGYEPPGSEAHFWVAWSRFDVLGHRVDLYEPHYQERFPYLTPFGHSAYWKDPCFYDLVVDWLEAGVTGGRRRLPPPEDRHRERVRRRSEGRAPCARRRLRTFTARRLRTFTQQAKGQIRSTGTEV